MARARLPAAEQQTLRDQVLVARGSVKPANLDSEIEAETDRLLQERLKQNPEVRANVAAVRKELRDQIKAQFQVVPPNTIRQWNINLGLARRFLRDQPLQLRIKFNSADRTASGTFLGLWQAGVPGKTQFRQFPPMSLAPDTFHEIDIPPNLFDDKGVLAVSFANPNNTTLLFPLEDGIEVLYREGGFGLNFARGLGIIFCWMSLLAAVGLAAASFLSFPVAAFLSLGILTMVFSSGTLEGVVSEGTVASYNPETGKRNHSPADVVVVPFFRAALDVINLAGDFSPIDKLSSGRSIPWSELAAAFAQIVLLLGGITGLIGSSCSSAGNWPRRRERNELPAQQVPVGGAGGPAAGRGVPRPGCVEP